jgi:hypothetical protein
MFFCNRALRDDNSNTVVATVSPAVISAPRPVTRRRREAGVLAPGLWLLSPFPKLEASVDRGHSLAGYSCGGSRGISPRSNLSPLREPCARREYYSLMRRGQLGAAKLLGMMAQMIGHEGLDEVVAVIIPLLHAKIQALP